MTTERDTQNFSSVIEEMKSHGMKLPSGQVCIAVPNAKEVLSNAMRCFISLEGKQAVWLPEYDKVAESIGMIRTTTIICGCKYATNFWKSLNFIQKISPPPQI